MARPLRIEFSGALYHITSRGDGREDIYLDDGDRSAFLDVLKLVCERFNWVCHAYCLMSNHYHLLIETPDSNLSQGMRQLNGVYTQRFNVVHHRVGHVFQGRYRAILVQKDAYLLELARYIVLNPVRAQMVRSAKDWKWSSFRATAGMVDAPDWLQTNWLLAAFAVRKVLAVEKYQDFVSEGKNQPSPWESLRNQIYLGDDNFVDDMQCKMAVDVRLDEVPGAQKRPVSKPISHYEKMTATRNDAIYYAYASGGYSMAKIAEHFGLHYSTVSKVIKCWH